MTAALFIAFLVLMVAIVGMLIARYVSGRYALAVLGALAGWFIYVGVIGHFGVIRNTSMRPPGVVFLFLPIILFLGLFILRTASASGGRFAAAFPLWILLATQCFRVGVELFIHQLWKAGLAPKTLTFEGANVDIYIGASAPILAWICTRGRWGLRAALVWNVLGLLALANVVIRAVLTTPGPLNRIHAEVPNQMIGTFPYTFIPAFFVPLAIGLHVLAIRAITQRNRIR